MFPSQHVQEQVPAALDCWTWYRKPPRFSKGQFQDRRTIEQAGKPRPNYAFKKLAEASVDSALKRKTIVESQIAPSHYC